MNAEKDKHDVTYRLDSGGLTFNANSIRVNPLQVILTIGPCELRIPEELFRKFAEWYLDDQHPGV